MYYYNWWCTIFCSVLFLLKSTASFLSLYGFFFLCNNDFPCEFLSQYSLQLAFVPIFSHCSAYCHISLLKVVHVFTKSISLEILNLLKLYDSFIVALKNCMLISFAWKPFKVFCISRNKEISRLMMVYFAESV